MTITFITDVGEYVARINRCRDVDGSRYVYTVTCNGNPSGNGLADSFEDAERAVRRLLAGHGHLCVE